MLNDKEQFILEFVFKLLYIILWLFVWFGSIIAVLFTAYAYILKFITYI